MTTDNNSVSVNRNLTGWWWTPFAIFWWGLKRLLVLVIAVVVVGNVWSWIDPPEPLRISSETTLITEPVAADGYPDYVAAMLDRMGRGVAPDKNGAVEFWQAMGSASISPEYREVFFAEIGMPAPQGDVGFSPADEQPWVSRFSCFVRPEIKDAEFEIDDGELAGKLVSVLLHRPMDPVDAAIADWVNHNTPALDRLVASSTKPIFYSPSPELVGDTGVPIVESHRPHLEVIRDAAVGLGLRSMTRLTSGNLDDAWSDAIAMVRLGRRNTEIPDAVNGIAGTAVVQMAFGVMPAIFSGAENEDGNRLMEKAVETLAELPEPDWAVSAIGFGEPSIYLDEMVRAVSPSRKVGALDLSANVNNLELNTLFGELRLWQIRTEEIAAITNKPERIRGFHELENELFAASQITPWKPIHSFFSRDARSRNIALIWSQLILPSCEILFASEDRSCAQQRLTLLAAALKLHQLRHGEYPESLDALAPEPLAEIPLDPFTNKPFVYERRGEGFAIWSLGRNGVDDGGSDQSGEFVDGEYAPIDWTGERPKPDGPDDVVVRLPVPALELLGAAP